ncbi:hypothetical protein P5673_030044 [Acropora cervicornis]|uniref:Integrase zinc-binding domain-containing protein n=1 Tax=Acropora cervicornis TaxID=6130 RepID=A0AAD9UTX5_ACRCE|nr:hypothetical protein P5673_030044 [Acropora cervicornis]
MQSHLRKYKPPPRKTKYFKTLSNYAIPDAGMKSTSITLTRMHCVNSRTRKVWFPGIDTAVDDAIRRCIPCQANTARQHTEPQAKSEKVFLRPAVSNTAR